MLHLIPANDYTLINAKIPLGHSFGYIDEEGRYILDDYSVQFFPFDINITCMEAIGKTYDAYLPTLVPWSSLKCKIFRYVPEEALSKYDILGAPVDLDYKTGLNIRLVPKHTFVKGELRKTDYYSDTALTDKILTVDMVYTRDALGFATSRTITRSWVREDESYHPDVKVTDKSYSINVIDQIKEGITRRENIINNLQQPTLLFMVTTMSPMSQTQIILLGRAFMDRLEDTMQKFIKNSSTVTDLQSPDLGKKTLWVAFRDAPETWLDNKPAQLGGSISIRQYLMNEVNI